MRVAFFHGLESSPKTDKNEFLEKFDYVYDPPMDYHDNGLFEKTLAEVKKNKIDLLIGSSMGGWFAYCIGTLTGIPTLLFNPAVHSRSFDPTVRLGTKRAVNTIVFGRNDDDIVPKESNIYFLKHGIGTFYQNYENNGHRTPIDIFSKWVNYCENKFLKKNEGVYRGIPKGMRLNYMANTKNSLNERKLTDFKYPWTIIASNHGNSRVQFSGSSDHYIVKFNALGLKSTLCFFESDKLKSSGNGLSSMTEVSKVFSTIQAIIEEYLNLHPSVTVYFVGADSPGEETEEGKLNKRGRVYVELIKDNIKPGFHWKMAKDGIGLLIALEETPLFESINEEWATDAPGVGADYSFLPEEISNTLHHNFLGKMPPAGNLTIEDNHEIGLVKSEMKRATEEDKKFALAANDSPPELFYQWLTIRGEKPSMKELKDLWKHEGNIELVNNMKVAWQRLRPYMSHNIVPLSGTTSNTYSFPSGHSCGAHYMACMLANKYPHLANSLTELADKIGNSRILSGVHYPSDVEEGKKIGIALAKKETLSKS